MERRDFLKNGFALGAASTLSAGCSKVTEPQSPVTYQPGKPLPWINWAGNQHCTPQWRYLPENEEQLADAIKAAKGTVRAVGSGHSFSPVVPTNDSLIALDLMNGLVDYSTEKNQTTFKAGTTIFATGPLLESVGQALPNMPDMDYPTLAGAVVNSVHATGINFGSMSSYVKDFRLVTPSGDIIDCSEQSNPDIFKAGLTSVGSMGIISQMTLQNQPSFALTEVNKVEVLEEVLEDIENRVQNNRHFELYAIPYSKLTATVTTNIAKPGDVNIGEDDPQTVYLLRKVFNATSWIPSIGGDVYDKVLQMAMAGEAETQRTGPSYKVFPHVRVVRFREMEYTVPAELGPACIREIMHTIKNNNIPLAFPMEYRYVKGDDIWMSMFEGQDGCSISVHQFGDQEYKKIFAMIEPIFWKYQGRPHWGKIHTLGSKELAALYPKHWQDFHNIRESLDPTGKMLNQHLRKIFL